MDKKVKVISDERVAEILGNGIVKKTADMGYALVHSVTHDGEDKIVISSSLGISFKITM